MGLKAGETLLVLPDPKRLSIAQALVARGRELGAETLLMEMSERETNGTEPPPAAAAAMLECDVFIAPTTKSISHTAARKEANARGVRAATMPQITRWEERRVGKGCRSRGSQCDAQTVENRRRKDSTED